MSSKARQSVYRAPLLPIRAFMKCTPLLPNRFQPLRAASRCVEQSTLQSSVSPRFISAGYCMGSNPFKMLPDASSTLQLVAMMDDREIPIPHDDGARKLYDINVINPAYRYQLIVREIDENPIEYTTKVFLIFVAKNSTSLFRRLLSDCFGLTTACS